MVSRGLAAAATLFAKAMKEDAAGLAGNWVGRCSANRSLLILRTSKLSLVSELIAGLVVDVIGVFGVFARLSSVIGMEIFCDANGFAKSFRWIIFGSIGNMGLIWREVATGGSCFKSGRGVGWSSN